MPRPGTPSCDLVVDPYWIRHLMAREVSEGELPLPLIRHTRRRVVNERTGCIAPPWVHNADRQPHPGLRDGNLEVAVVGDDLSRRRGLVDRQARRGASGWRCSHPTPFPP